MYNQVFPITTDSLDVKTGLQTVKGERSIQDSNTSTMINSKSRIPSLTSLLSDSLYLSKNEKIGIRKLARACTRNLVQWNTTGSDGEIDRINSGFGKVELKDDLCEISIDNQKIPVRTPFKKKLLFSDYFEYDRVPNIESGNKGGTIPRNSFSNKVGKEGILIEPKTSQTIDSRTIPLTVTSHPLISDAELFSGFSERNKKEVNVKFDSKMDDALVANSLLQNRVVVVGCLPRYTGINSVLAQTCGGPLERVVFRSGKKLSSFGGSRIELHYLNPADAQNFLDFSKTGLFLVNGEHLCPYWASKENTENFGSSGHPPVTDYLSNEMQQNGARRCLILKKNIRPQKTEKSLGETNIHHCVLTQFAELDIEDIKKDFGIFGGIIDMQPIISRKLCFSLQFYDVRSAIVAKRECETTGSNLHGKYHEWSVWYGKDPADRSCVEL